jgi:hypothetical protein
MGFHKRYIDESWVLSAFRADGAEGIYNLFTNPDALILQDNTAKYISVVLDKGKDKKDTLNLIETYIQMRLDGLIGK